MQKVLKRGLSGSSKDGTGKRGQSGSSKDGTTGSDDYVMVSLLVSSKWCCALCS